MSKLSECTPSEKQPESPIAHGSPLLSQQFSSEQRQTLLRIAHEAILSVLNRQPFPEVPLPAGLLEPRGVFTTLYLNPNLTPGDDLSKDELPNDDPQVDSRRERRRELRGCVGYAVPVAPLHRAVAETARAAAFQDSRFLPVTKDEASRLEVSLSVLSHLSPVHPDSVEVGRHGLVISDGARRGLLLPQVPVENGWDREIFLEQTCRKAGLPLDAWRKNATIEAFTAEVFSDFDPEVPC
jgi:AmmeMemoRadiSam system protein A